MLSLSLSLLPFRLRGALDGSQLERPPCSLVPLLERNADFAGEHGAWSMGRGAAGRQGA